MASRLKPVHDLYRTGLSAGIDMCNLSNMGIISFHSEYSRPRPDVVNPTLNPTDRKSEATQIISPILGGSPPAIVKELKP